MKLQVGSSIVKGMYKEEEWTNLDIVPHRGVDVVADASVKIPFPTNTFEEIHCIHVFEHLRRHRHMPMLQEMYRVLKPGGVLYVETPDFKGTVDNLLAAFIDGNVEAIHKWTTSVYGKNERDWMAHHWGFYEGLLRRKFRECLFKEVDRLTEVEDMISLHYKQEPVLLVKGTK
jgi:predicted SAM-dependent methyltransferase